MSDEEQEEEEEEEEKKEEDSVSHGRKIFVAVLYVHISQLHTLVHTHTYTHAYWTH